MSLPATEIASIYVIRNVSSGQTYWVGRTRTALRERFYSHCGDASNTLYHFIAEIGRKNLEIVEVARGTASDEKELVKRLANEGHPLRNKQYLHGWPRKKGPRDKHSKGIWKR